MWIEHFLEFFVKLAPMYRSYQCVCVAFVVSLSSFHIEEQCIVSCCSPPPSLHLNDYSRDTQVLNPLIMMFSYVRFISCQIKSPSASVKHFNTIIASSPLTFLFFVGKWFHLITIL